MRASSCADALSPRAARFTKWIIFKHKKFSLTADDTYRVPIEVHAMRDGSYFAAVTAALPTIPQFVTNSASMLRGCPT